MDQSPGGVGRVGPVRAHFLVDVDLDLALVDVEVLAEEAPLVALHEVLDLARQLARLLFADEDLGGGLNRGRRIN